MTVNPRWDEIFNERPWGMEPATGVILLFAIGYYFSDRPNIKVLELGCGTGANLWYLACEGYQVYGMDGSPTAIAKTREVLDHLRPEWKGELVLGDLTTLPWQDDTFDVVIDVNSVTCNTLDDMKRIYQEARRVLKPDGFLHSQIFALGTNPVCLAPGTIATCCGPNDLLNLYGDFGVPLVEQRSRPYKNVDNIVYEWMVSTRKPVNESDAWKHQANQRFK